MQLLGALERLLRLRELGGRLLHVGRLLDRRQTAGFGGAVLRERARERRLLLIEAVLPLLAIELDERLAGLHAIAEVGEDAADLAVGFRRHRHLVDGRERADDFDGPVDRFLANRLDLDGLRGRIAAARLRRLRFRACGARERQGHKDSCGKYTHKNGGPRWGETLEVYDVARVRTL